MKGIYNNRAWFILESFGFGILRIIALILCGLFSQSGGFLYGLIFIIAGGIWGLRSLITARAPGLLLSLLGAACFIAAGIILFVKANSSEMSFLLYCLAIVTWIQAVVNFLISGMRFRSNNWGFLFVSCLVSAAIGVLYVLQPPATTVSWGVSILFGVNFLFYAGCQFMTAATASED